jgi:bifunctional non-homologous end joining protein LigD
MGGAAGEGGRNWLLIKHRDRAARPNAKTDFLARHARSVLSNRNMEEIATAADRVWSSNRTYRSRDGKTPSRAASSRKTADNSRQGSATKPGSIGTKDVATLPGARRAKMPTKLKPQLATLVTDVPAGDDWLHELKFDGYRVLVFLDNGSVRCITRNGNDWTGRFPALVNSLAGFGVRSAVLDGEIVSLDEEGRSNFQQLQNFMKLGDDETLVYYLFDVPYFEGFDLTKTPLVERKQLLARLVLSANPENEGPVRYSDHVQGSGENVFQHACRSALEGVVSKRADSLYQQFRSSTWLKVKCLKRQEFVIGGYTKPEGSRAGFGALLLGYYKDGSLTYCGRVGTGFTRQSLRDLAAGLKKRRIDSPAFKNPPTGSSRRGVTWVRPELVAEVEFTEWTNDGSLRHPSFQGLREDKPPEQIVREDVDMPVVEPQSSSRRRTRSSKSARSRSKTSRTRRSRRRTSPKGSRESTIAGVHITHPDRVLYPEEGLTKLDLAEYYEQIADWILPYVAGRPLTLVRCPEGRAGKCFYQKHLTGSLPDAVRGVMVQEKQEREEYVVIDDLAGLVSLVQMGVLEMHPWPAREDKLERPDMLVFDLDPGEGVAWSRVIQGAKEARDRLEALGLKSFLRTTGGKGLHVVAPLARRNTWDELKAFAKGFADRMVHDSPGTYIATMSKDKRRGKVFVDYLRNQRGATAIASYSTRARVGATVSMPLAWNEVTGRLDPEKFNVETTPKRLSARAADPWADFSAIRQSLTANALRAVK